MAVAEVEVRFFRRCVERFGRACGVRFPYFLVLTVASGERFRELSLRSRCRRSDRVARVGNRTGSESGRLPETKAAASHVTHTRDRWLVGSMTVRAAPVAPVARGCVSGRADWQALLRAQRRCPSGGPLRYRVRGVRLRVEPRGCHAKSYNEPYRLVQMSRYSGAAATHANYPLRRRKFTTHSQVSRYGSRFITLRSPSVLTVLADPATCNGCR
jgi:hypothetical protein